MEETYVSFEDGKPEISIKVSKGKKNKLNIAHYLKPEEIRPIGALMDYLFEKDLNVFLRENTINNLAYKGNLNSPHIQFICIQEEEKNFEKKGYHFLKDILERANNFPKIEINGQIFWVGETYSEDPFNCYALRPHLKVPSIGFLESNPEYFYYPEYQKIDENTRVIELAIGSLADFNCSGRFSSVKLEKLTKLVSSGLN